jgi:DNA-directed RNA polymerase specialized sigma24 family protein
VKKGMVMKQPFEKVVEQHGGTVLRVCRVVLGVPGDGDKDGDLWHAVAALPAKQRQAVAYHYIAGLAYAQIAEILGGTTDGTAAKATLLNLEAA